MTEPEEKQTPCRDARWLSGGVLLFFCGGVAAGMAARWGIPLTDAEAEVLRSLGLTGLPGAFFWLRGAEALATGAAAGVCGRFLTRWRGRGARLFALLACFALGASWLIQLLRYRWDWAQAPVACLAAGTGIFGALGAALLLRRGHWHWARPLLALGFALCAGAVAERRAAARIEWDSSAATAAVAADWRGGGGRIFLLSPLPEGQRAALALLLGETPEILERAGLEQAGAQDVIIADTRWTVQPSIWRFAAFFNGTCVLQRRSGAERLPEDALVRMTETGRDYGQADRIAD